MAQPASSAMLAPDATWTQPEALKAHPELIVVLFEWEQLST